MIIPRKIKVPGHPEEIKISPVLQDISLDETAAVLEKLGTSLQGLTQEEAGRRLAQYGPNRVAQDKRHSRWRLLGRALINPLVVLLSVLALISLLTGDVRAATVMLLMVGLGVILRFVQESKADNAAARLKSLIRVTATAWREGEPREIPLEKLVPGDVVKLSAGDMIPADIRILSCKDLFVIQASLTGESLPTEKFEHQDAAAARGLLDLSNICFLGTSVERGSATAVVVHTGLQTYLDGMASVITEQVVETSFDKGISRFTWLMIRFMMVMVPLVFIINGITKHKKYGCSGRTGFDRARPGKFLGLAGKKS